jgi:hypothetical protein
VWGLMLRCRQAGRQAAGLPATATVAGGQPESMHNGGMLRTTANSDCMPVGVSYKHCPAAPSLP